MFRRCSLHRWASRDDSGHARWTRVDDGRNALIAEPLSESSGSPVSSRRAISTASFGSVPGARLGCGVPCPHSMKNGSSGSAAALSTPASLHVRTCPLGAVRDPALTLSSCCFATASRDVVRTAQPIGWRTTGRALATHRPNGLRSATRSSVTATSSGYAHDGHDPVRVPQFGWRPPSTDARPKRPRRARLAAARSDVASST